MKMTILCLINTAFMVVGQILFKLGSNGKDMSGIKNILLVFFSPIILIALFLYGCTTILWLYILSKVEISFAYPIQALAFPVVLIISAVLFHEVIPINRWIGVAVIFLGVYIAVMK